MADLVNQIRVECHTGLSGDTPIIVGDKMITMRQLHIGYSGQAVSTLGVNLKTFQMDEAEILEIPQEIYTPSIVHIGVHYGQHLDCTPGSLILTTDGFKRADAIRKGDTLKILFFNNTNHETYTGDGHITVYENESVLALQTPVYVFITEYQNILIPYHTEGSDIMAFINVRQ